MYNSHTYLLLKKNTGFTYVWVLEVGLVQLGLEQIEKETLKSQKHFLISKYLFMLGSPKLFMMAKFALTNLIKNANYQNSI